MKVSGFDLRELANHRFDLIVVGGGIQGCGIARDASLRGLRVLLLEKNDLGAGSSSATSKLVHGGLRYLEQMRFGLVRESLTERDTLLRIAPHLVRPLPFLLPLYRGRGRGRWKVAAGLTVYDILARRGNLNRHKMISSQQVVQREPDLVADGLSAGAIYHDAQMNDARLVLENAVDAREHGATILTRVECIDLLQRQSRIQGVRAKDVYTGREVEIEAGLVVNAAGPWYSKVIGQQSLTRRENARLSRGTHIVLPALTKGHALLLQARRDGRIFFVLPWKGHSLVGTTDVEYNGDPDDVTATEEDIYYLLEETANAFAGQTPGRADVLAAFAGVRALSPDGDEEIGDVSRQARVREEAPGLLCVMGGKYTTYRAVAERAVDLAQTLLERSHAMTCSTAQRVLPGGEIPDMNDYFRVAEKILVKETGLPVSTLRYILGSYGSRHGEILKILKEDPAHGESIEPGLPFTRAEVIHAVRNEFAMDVEDLLWRRTYRGFLGPLDERARRRWQEALDVGMRSRQQRMRA